MRTTVLPPSVQCFNLKLLKSISSRYVWTYIQDIYLEAHIINVHVKPRVDPIKEIVLVIWKNKIRVLTNENTRKSSEVKV